MHNTYSIRIIFIVTLWLTNLANAGNPPTQDAITAYLVNHQQEQLQFLEQLVNINSGTANISGVHKIGALLQPQFEALGFKVRWAEEPPNMHRAGTLIASHEGHSGKKILMIGHLDTVFPVSSSFQRFEKHGALATGPGVIDDKGGDVVILYALKALEAAHVLDHADITVILTGDEESSGKPTSISRKPLLDAAKDRDVALDFEWAITPDTATIARRGIANWVIKTEGNEGHSSEIFKKSGYGAIYELVRIINDMRTQLSDEKYLSFNPGLILGGTDISFDKTNSQGNATGVGNVISKTAMSKGDLRFLTEEQKMIAVRKIAAIVRAHLPETKASIAFEDGIPAMPPTSNNVALLKKYSQASVALGHGTVDALDPGSRGAGDISHVAAIIPFALAGLGPVGTGAHSKKETLVIQSLLTQTQRAALLLYWLTTEHH